MKNQTPNQPHPDRPVDCPCCGHEFDVRQAKVAFVEPVGPHEGVVYAFCPTCHPTFEASDPAGQKTMANRCFQNVKSDYQTGRLSRDWALTTLITLRFQGWNLADAIWEGVDIPRPLYDAIVDGKLQICLAGPCLFTGCWVDETEVSDGTL